MEWLLHILVGGVLGFFGVSIFIYMSNMINLRREIAKRRNSYLKETPEGFARILNPEDARVFCEIPAGTYTVFVDDGSYLFFFVKFNNDGTVTMPPSYPVKASSFYSLLIQGKMKMTVR